MLELTLGEAIAKIDSGDLSPDEYRDAYRDARPRVTSSTPTCPTTRGEEGEASGGRRAARRPGRRQGHLLHRGGRRPRPARRSSRGTCRCTTRPRSGSSGRRGHRPRQDQHGRVRDGLVERELGLRRRAQPLGHRSRARRLLGRLGGGGRRQARPGRARDRHRRLDPPARLALRDRRPEAHLRRDLALRDDRLRLVARPVRAPDPRRHRRGAAAARDGGARPLRLDLGRHRGRGRAAPRPRT